MFNHLMFACLFCCGLVLIHRGTLTNDDFKTLSGKVVEKEVVAVGKYRSGNEKYALTFKIENRHDKLGIYIGPESSIKANSSLRNIQLNKYYKFYIDPTVISSKGVNLGVRKIEQADLVLYEENTSAQPYIGIIVSILILVFWYYYAKKK